MPDTLIKFKTGDLSKMDNGATDEVGINNGTVYFATDDTTKNGKIYFDSPEGDRIDMTAYAKESNYATLAGNIDGTVSVANGGTGATDAATARTNLGIPVAGTTATAVGTTAKGGSATTWSKSDHVHNITLATGDNNGQVKIAGTNVSVKGLGSAAYTNSTAYASAANEITHLKDGSAEGSLRATGTMEESSTYSLGQRAVALGAGTKASGKYSYAEGGGTTASGESAHAEGGSTTASGNFSHAEGGGTTASGNESHAEGRSSFAQGECSHAEGNGTTARYRSQHVFGEYNILDPYLTDYDNRGIYVEIVGKGTADNDRSNARTLDWSGNEVLSGKLTVGTDPTNNMDVATKQYVDNAFAVNDAMIFKGVLDSPSNIPDTHQAGWTYRIGTTGTYAGQICEVGDLLICVADGTEASNNDWNVVQNNLDGALFKGTNTFTSGQILIADGVTGKTKTSGFTIAKSVPNDAKFTDTTYTFDGTYNASTNKAATVSTVTNAVNALDGNLNNTTPGAAKTLTAFSQTNGKISATFSNISITKSQISDFPTSLTPTSHTHGNITNDGALSTASRAVVTDANKKITIADMTVTSPTAATTTSTTFIDTVSQASNGKISATKKTLPTASTSTAGIIQIGTGSGNAAAGNHTHTASLATDTGTSSITLASAGKYKLTAGGSSIIFTMPTSNNYSHPTGDGNLHVPANGTTNNGKFLRATATAGSYQWASLSSSDITTALGFTPYNSTNPNGYTSNTGTITGVTGSDGLTGSGTSGSVTIKHAAPSTSPATTTSAIYPITIDKYGHITAKGSAVTPLTANSTLDASKLSGTIPASCYTNTTYGAEKGINLSSGKFGHSNTAITAQTTQAVYPIKIDAYGHITGYGSAVTSMPASDVPAWAKATSKPTYTASEVGALPMPSGGSSGQFLGLSSDGTATWVANPNTDTKVTSVGNHYTPAADTSAALSADASSTTAATWGTTSLITGVNLQRDAKGHVTGITVDSIKMPANPNTDTKNTAGSTNSDSKLFLIGATSQAANPQTYSDAEVYTTNGTLSTKILSASTGVNANTAGSGSAGGVSLFATNPESYGLLMRHTGTSSGQLGKHGYVQGDWAGYLTFNGATNRGYIFRHAGGNVASVSGEGHAVFNGTVTVGGNTTNTSGVRMEYNSTTESLDFIFN